MGSKVLIAMSGGVDSSAAALLLREQGYVCAGCTMKLYDNKDTGILIHCNHRGSLYLWQRPETVVVSTQPLNQASWMEVPLNTLLACRRGKLVYTGKPHSHEYVKPDDGEPPLLPELTDGSGI